MEEVVVGVVPAPELPATIARKLSLSLEKKLTEYIDDEVCWKVEIEIDSLTGAAEKVKEIMDEAKKLKEKNDWNYVICLTDLPIFNGKFIVLADADVEAKIAQISLPAFGTLPTPKRVRKTLVHMVKKIIFSPYQHG
ncbi:hypothetical protein ACFSMW_18430 [Virgibacillus halophilus]|uniref:Uncharacterized protein n=1 Tax=Tigheibacillus halophilus TaxID=361280 RepID=A0ABU5C8B0_9BACI|nr:hypothetical protein [Virgibacillus halophilus]